MTLWHWDIWHCDIWHCDIWHCDIVMTLWWHCYITMTLWHCDYIVTLWCHFNVVMTFLHCDYIVTLQHCDDINCQVFASLGHWFTIHMFCLFYISCHKNLRLLPPSDTGTLLTCFCFALTTIFNVYYVYYTLLCHKYLRS